MEKNIIEKNYYIIKVTCDNGKKVYYKVGEALSKSRPEKLVEKYRQLRSNDAELLLFEVLPHNQKQRLNDKTIHANLDPAVLATADPIYVEHYVHETDGKNEFFECVDSTVNVVDYVKSVVQSLSHGKFYTAANTFNTELDYGTDNKHKVNGELMDKILNFSQTAYDILYEDIQNPVLLIGQFDFDFISSIAMYNNIVLWHDSKEQRHTYSFNRINEKITYVDTLEEILTMDTNFDLIIANPPYGKIGANITKSIIDNVDFKEYVNLLPANDYKRNIDKDLYNYQSDMEPINDGFADAAVTTHVARIHKTRVNNMTLDEFERSNYIDPQLDKYFAENSKRKHYAIDVAQARPKWTKAIQDAVTVNNSFIIHMRDANHGYIPNDTTKKNLATSVRWNLLKEISLDYLHDNYWQNDTQSVYGFITFKSDLERDNFTDFMLKHGWKFMCKVMKAMCVDCTVAFSKYLPKVDWTRSWTVEEILADYGYDADEIQAVMDDLQNFKGMED